MTKTQKSKKLVENTISTFGLIPKSLKKPSENDFRVAKRCRDDLNEALINLYDYQTLKEVFDSENYVDNSLAKEVLKCNRNGCFFDLNNTSIQSIEYTLYNWVEDYNYVHEELDVPHKEKIIKSYAQVVLTIEEFTKRIWSALNGKKTEDYSCDFHNY